MPSYDRVFNMINRVMENGGFQKNKNTYFRNKELYIKLSRSKEGYENVHYRELTEAEKSTAKTIKNAVKVGLISYFLS